MQLTDIQIPRSVEGQSLFPIIQNTESKVRDHLLFAYTSLHRAVREERYKLIEYNVKGKRTTQLFDLFTDPFELNNLTGNSQYSGILKGLRREIIRWRDELDDTRDQGKVFWEGYANDAPGCQ